MAAYTGHLMLSRSVAVHLTAHRHLMFDSRLCPVIQPPAKETEDRKTHVTNWSRNAALGSDMAERFITFSGLGNAFGCTVNYPSWVQYSSSQYLSQQLSKLKRQQFRIT